MIKYQIYNYSKANNIASLVILFYLLIAYFFRILFGFYYAPIIHSNNRHFEWFCSYLNLLRYSLLFEANRYIVKTQKFHHVNYLEFRYPSNKLQRNKAKSDHSYYRRIVTITCKITNNLKNSEPIVLFYTMVFPELYIFLDQFSLRL